MKYVMADRLTCKFEELKVGEFFKNPFNDKAYLKIAGDLDTLMQHRMGSSGSDKNKNVFCLEDDTLDYFMPDANAVPLEPDLILTEKRN